MTALMTGLGLALLASFALNGSYLVQHAGVAGAPAVSARHPLATFRGLLTSRLWVAGLVLGLGGWALHVGALAHAPLSLVQAFAAGGLALIVPAGARVLGQRLSREEGVAIGVMALALVMLALGAAPAVAGASFSALGMGAYLIAALGGAALLAALAPAAHRPHALGAAAGILYGAADAATKAVTVGHGSLAGWLTSPWLLAVAITSAGAFFAFQRGLQTGAALPVIALMTAATNLVAIIAGVLVFGDGLGVSPVMVGVHLVAFALVGLAAWLLAPAQARLTTGLDPA